MKKGEHFTILLAGDCTPNDGLRNETAETRTIAADAGIRHADALALTPELWVGDFDSADADLAKRYSDVPRMTFPAAKDATDGEIAVRAALERGASRLTVIGAFGGPRIDHALATIALALSLPADVAVRLTDGVRWGVPLDERRPVKIDASPGATLSLVGLTDLHGLTLTGVRWPLNHADVPFGSSLTVSNEIAAEGTAAASVRIGRALVVVEETDTTRL